MKYRYHWSFKLLAFLLALTSGAVLALGAAGLPVTRTAWYEDIRLGQLYADVGVYCHHAAEAVFDKFAWLDTGIEPKLFERFFRWGADVDAAKQLEYGFYHSIRNTKTGQVYTDNTGGVEEWGWMDTYVFDVRRGYVTEMPKAEYYPAFEEFTESIGWRYVDLEGTALPDLGEGVTEYEYYVVSDEGVNRQDVSTDSFIHADANGADYTIYRIEYTHYESYEVEIRMTPEQVDALVNKPMDQEFLPKFTAEYAQYFAPMAIWGGIGLLAAVLWLTLVAGRSPRREELKPQGLNRIPLDLWLAVTVLGAVAVVFAAVMLLENMMYSSVWGNYDSPGGKETFLLEAGLLGLCGSGAGVLLAMFFMAASAQLKMGDGYWLKHTILALCRKWIRRGARWCCRRGSKLVRGIRTGCGRLWAWLPLCWQWLLLSGGMWVLMFLCIRFGLFARMYLLLLFGIAVTMAAVLYGAYCFGALRDGAKKMSGGNLSEKIENRYLLGCFGEFAGHLNTLGHVCVESARQQMKSERMKSELITNVSHDIKTPLTSIINYVDLLRRTGDEEQRAEYLEVLDRQSQQLKKLLEDLMEMSRASSGNVAVEITPTDLCEAVNQALGEFSDKLESRGLKIMLKAPQEPLMALCDGRHLWRVLSNCLSNVVKYALPGTRVYVDVLTRESNAEISLKNISAEMLNVSADELAERFVRGDASRNTDGNGLGLNIARSLMELQGGRLDLVVDGDLFKVILTLNTAETELSS